MINNYKRVLRKLCKDFMQVLPDLHEADNPVTALKEIELVYDICIAASLTKESIRKYENYIKKRCRKNS